MVQPIVLLQEEADLVIRLTLFTMALNSATFVESVKSCLFGEIITMKPMWKIF